MNSEIYLFDFGILLATGGFCLVWATGLAIGRRIGADLAAIGLIATSGARLLWEAYYLSNLAFSSPTAYGLVLPLCYLIGPALFVYYERLADRPLNGWFAFHLAPCVLALVPAGIWLGLGYEKQLILLQGLDRGPVGLFEMWVLGPKISILFYSLFIPLRKSGEGSVAIRALPGHIRNFALLLLLYVYLMIIADIGGYVFNLPLLYRGSAYSHGLVAIAVYLYSRRNPGAMLEVVQAIRSSRYQKSKIQSLDLDSTLARINQVMQGEAFYTDEDLRLGTFAEACDLSPHQLSEILNTRLNLSFNQFVNRFRVEAVCELMHSQPGRNILSIALSAGFNSKSAFHRAFKKEKGITPQQFRQKLAR